jgi:hypothetical protein
MSSDLDTPDRMRMACQMVQADSPLNVPNPNTSVTRSRHRDRATIQNFEASDCRRMPTQSVKAFSVLKPRSTKCASGEKGNPA